MLNALYKIPEIKHFLNPRRISDSFLQPCRQKTKEPSVQPCSYLDNKNDFSDSQPNSLETQTNYTDNSTDNANSLTDNQAKTLSGQQNRESRQLESKENSVDRNNDCPDGK